MTYLITGGTGFLGSYITKQLLEQGENVVLMSRSAPKANSMSEILTPEQIAKAVYAQGDVQDLDRIIEICKENSVDIIIHPASLLLADCEKDPIAAVRINIIGTLNIFEAARACGIKRVVWASSNSAIGNAYNPDSVNKANAISPDAHHNPVTIYGKIKDYNEFMTKFYNERYGTEFIALRYNVLYGKGRRRGGANYIKSMLNDPALGIPSVCDYGDDSPNLCYIEDAARATVLACKAPYKRYVYNISGTPIALADLREYVLKLLPDAQIELRPGIMDLAWKYDTSLEEAELGYKPEVDILDGALLTINDVREFAGLPPVQAPEKK